MKNKDERYRDVLAQVRSLCDGERDVVAVMANVCALLHGEFGFWWTGFYRVVPACGAVVGSGGDGGGCELVLGPFQGPVACVRIGYGRGVCGTAWRLRRTVVVPDVEAFPGHIACSGESRSEVVVPVFGGDEVVAVLDVDSRDYAAFDDTDVRWLEAVAAVLARGFAPAGQEGGAVCHL